MEEGELALISTAGDKERLVPGVADVMGESCCVGNTRGSRPPWKGAGAAKIMFWYGIIPEGERGKG